jgi:NAD+ kinase
MHRECEGKRVIVVCHGEVMWAFRMRLERLSQERWLELDRSQDRRDRMNNGQVIHYSRRNPVTGHIASSLNWSRSIVPCNQDWSRPEWTQITRSAYSNEDLLRVVRAYPRLFDGEY